MKKKKMTKLRKTLLSLEDPCIVALDKRIATQTKDTLLNWCLCYAQERLLPLYEERVPGEKKPQEALEAAWAWQRGEIKLPAARKKILACHQAAREAEGDPVAQAAARAIGQAASTLHAVRHSLGFVFYGVAALCYDELGLDASKEEYDKRAKEYCQKMLDALVLISVEDEKDSVKSNWK